jgi:DNA invertase Pin-like site-specific DNA recombinase
MPKKKSHRDRMYQVVGEPGPGALAAGYVRYSSDMQSDASIVTQRRIIQEFAAKKGWVIPDTHWYEEPAQSAKYEDIEQRPRFAALLRDAGTLFQVVLCYSNSRWARNVIALHRSLNELRRKGVWWATATEPWDIDKVVQQGFDMAFALTAQADANYVIQLSKRVIDGKEDRARSGYHNGSVMFGYLPPLYPKPPDNAPSTWKPPRMPVRIDPVNFPALVRIGELVAAGWSDAAIADELEGHMTSTVRFGQRLLIKDTIATLRRSWFPREFAPGCGHGTIETPSGELVEGKHLSAWPYDLWQRMVEVKAGQYRRPTKEAQRRAHEFSRIIVCAACRRPLRASAYPGQTYYRDTSLTRKLPCEAHGCLTVNNRKVVQQLGDLLRSVRLPDHWKVAIAERCVDMSQDDGSDRARARRSELESERKRLVGSHAKGYLTEDELDEQMARIQNELLTLPVPIERDVEEFTQAAISAAETLADMAGYWFEAAQEERRDIIWALLNLNGLIYDLERQAMIGLLPRDDMLPVLALGLAPFWQQRDSGLWLAKELWPPKRPRLDYHMPPIPEPKLNAAQAAEARRLVDAGMSLRTIAKQFGVSRMAVHRALRREPKGGDG